MAVYENYLTREGFNVHVNSPSDYAAGALDCATRYLGDQPGYHKRMGDIQTEIQRRLLKTGVTPAQKSEPLGKLPESAQKLLSIKTEFETLIEYLIDEMLPDPPRGSVIRTYADIKNDFDATDTVKTAIERDRNVQTKVASVFCMDQGYKGHGPTIALGYGVLHCHVGNGDGIAFKWEGGRFKVIALGKKSDSAPSGNSGYNWHTK
jgi:hypothetical protein